MDNSSGPDPGNESFATLPPVGVSEILGLVEVLKSKGGREDIYKLAAELKMEFGETLNVIRGAEMLGLVNTPGGDVVIEPLGEKLTRAKINTRKTMLKGQIAKLPLFGKITSFLEEKDDYQSTRNQLLEKLAELMPNEDVEQTFTTLVNWGRYVELFGYNDDSQSFYLDSGK